MANTGYKRVITLRKYVDGVATTSTKANHEGDEDYVANFYDDSCIESGQATTTSTTTTSTTTSTTTTSAQEGVGKIAAVALCTGSSGSCISPLTRDIQNVIYIKIKSDDDPSITFLRKGSYDVGSLRNQKYVIDNSPTNLKYLDGGMSGFCYNRDEGIVDEATIINSNESIDATTPAGSGDYLVSAISILDAGSGEEAANTYYPKNTPLFTLYYNPSESRMEWMISNCLNIGGNQTIDNETLGGGGRNANEYLKRSDSAEQ
jgi:hypothetical protein